MTSGTTRRTPSTTTYKQGDVVLVSFPFTDLTSTKRRPAVVVSPDTLNARNEGVVLVAVTSQIVRDAATVLLGQRDVMDGVLPKDSAARVAKLFTLHSSLVVKRLCRLKGEKRDELLRELRSFFQECAGLELLPAANLSLGQKFADVFRETVEEHRATARG